MERRRYGSHGIGPWIVESAQQRGTAVLALKALATRRRPIHSTDPGGGNGDRRHVEEYRAATKSSCDGDLTCCVEAIRSAIG